jgi:DNA-binding NarL/FixJ family response regulator
MTAFARRVTVLPGSVLASCRARTRGRLAHYLVSRPLESMRKPVPEPDELTARELEILRYVARGFSNAEIAREASVSETTVKTHIAHILLKLRLRDRVQAVVFAHENGVVAPGTAA